MKAISIEQPLAHLIVTPQEELPDGVERARVYTRTWETTYRGKLLIASCARGWDKIHPFENMAYGAIIGVADLVDCIKMDPVLVRNKTRYVPFPKDAEKYPWLEGHQHCGGPICFVFGNVKRIYPIQCFGRPWLFDIPYSKVRHLPQLCEGGVISSDPPPGFIRSRCARCGSSVGPGGCRSSAEWCESNPLPDRADVPCGSLEWFKN